MWSMWLIWFAYLQGKGRSHSPTSWSWCPTRNANCQGSPVHSGASKSRKRSSHSPSKRRSPEWVQAAATAAHPGGLRRVCKWRCLTTLFCSYCLNADVDWCWNEVPPSVLVLGIFFSKHLLNAKEVVQKVRKKSWPLSLNSLKVWKRNCCWQRDRRLGSWRCIFKLLPEFTTAWLCCSWINQLFKTNHLITP